MTQYLHPLYGDEITDRWVARSIPGPAGVYEGLAPSISGDGGTSGWTASLAAGIWKTQGDDTNGRYLIEETAATTIAIAAPDATYSRIDLIVGIHAWVAGPEVTGTLTPSGEFSDDQKATYVVVEGTPAASPTAPTVLDPFTGSKRATVLAKVIVPISGTPTITRMNDLRFDTFAACRDEVVAAREGYVDLQARIDAITLTASTAVVTGAVQMYGGSTAPDGYLLCNGAAVSRTTYSALYSVIGTTFGTGDGSTTFNLPKITGRFPLGVSSTYMLGKTGGEETHTLTVDEMPAHTHPTYSRYTSNLQHDDNDEGDRGVLSTQGATTGSSGGGYAHNNMPPYLAMNFIIKT